MEITKGRIQSAQKVVLYGPEGIGKSFFASQFPNPVFIDTEGSTKHMDVARLPNPSSWTMLLKTVQHVKNYPATCDTLVIDTADWAERLCMEEICAKANKAGIEDFGYGKGYTYLAEEFGKLLNLLTEIIELGINVVVVAHATMRKFEQPDEMGAYDRWEMKLQKKVYPLLKEWADMVLFANYKTYVVDVEGKKKAQGGMRVMYTTHHSCWDAKNRQGLPDELEFYFKTIAHCFPTKETLTGQAPLPQPKQEVTAIRYWHHPESSCVYQGASPDGDGLSVEIDKKEYERLSKIYAVRQTPKPEPVEIAVKTYSNIPKSLFDLMSATGVDPEEIQKVVAQRGYYPEDMPIDKYDPVFIEGVLVGAWDQVFKLITENRVVSF